MIELDSQGRALLALGQALRTEGYHFVTPTPATHRLVVERERRMARDLRDIFGWSLPFAEGALPSQLLRLSRDAGVVSEHEAGLRANVRFSSLGERLFVHSAFPTVAADSVFFGPDTYRFCSLLARTLRPCKRLVDLGCGSGAGGLSVAARAERLVLADISPRALEYAAVNAALAGVEAELVRSDGLQSVTGPLDAIVANPPYLRDAAGRTYRDGGGDFGEALALRFLRESVERLSPGGVLILYTGAPIVAGEDVFFRSARSLCANAGLRVHYEELDPDVFGEELASAAYRGVERIAAVGLVAEAPA